VFYFLRKITEATNSKCSALPSSALLRIFFFSYSTVLLVGAQNYFLFRGAGTLATPLTGGKALNCISYTCIRRAGGREKKGAKPNLHSTNKNY